MWASWPSSAIPSSEGLKCRFSSVTREATASTIRHCRSQDSSKASVTSIGSVYQRGGKHNLGCETGLRPTCCDMGRPRPRAESFRSGRDVDAPNDREPQTARDVRPRDARGAAGITDEGGLGYPEESVARSEERRVGKECRSRWSPDDYKKKLK